MTEECDHTTAYPPPGNLFFCPICKNPLAGVLVCETHGNAVVLDCGCPITMDQFMSIIEEAK